MANIKVLTKAGNCACGCGEDGGVSTFPSQNPADSIVVRHKPGTVTGNAINKFNESGKTVYQLEDLSLVNPILSFVNDAPAIVEVGRTISAVIFNGAISAGTFPIVFRNITPNPGGLDLTAPFTFTKNNVTRSTPGVAQQHTLSATDDQNNVAAKVSGVTFKHAFYQGFNPASSLTEAQIKALANKTLVDTILSSYGGMKTYVVPGVDPQYIYWCGVVGSAVIGGASLNGFLLPLLDVGPIVVTNIYDPLLDITYWVKRTANKLDPGTYQIATS